MIANVPRPISEEHLQLTAQERSKYERVWQENVYREQSPAWRVRHELFDALGIKDFFSVAHIGKYIIDIGCGTAKLAEHLWTIGYNVTAVDIAHNAMGEPDAFEAGVRDGFTFVVSPIHDLRLPRHDAGYCVDVMEHIPQPLVGRTLKAISQICDKVYFRIALFPDEYGQTLGLSTLHQTVMPWQWWISELGEYFGIAMSYTEVDPHHGANVLVVITRSKVP